MKQTKVTKKQIEDYLEKSLKSENFKKNDPEKYEKNKQKLAKERLKLKLLFNT